MAKGSKSGGIRSSVFGGAKAGGGKAATGKKVQPAGKPFGTGGSYKGGHKASSSMKNC